MGWGYALYAGGLDLRGRNCTSFIRVENAWNKSTIVFELIWWPFRLGSQSKKESLSDVWS